MAARRLKTESTGLFGSSELTFEKAQVEASRQVLYVDAEFSRLRTARQPAS